MLANQASVDRRLVPTMERVAAMGFDLGALFGPQHGFFGHTQANMIEVGHAWDEKRQIPVYSLYGESRRPTAEMFKGVELLIVDLQDVGVRGYTFVWTLLYMMEGCAQQNVPMLILDRPNPLGGIEMEGPLLQPEFFSFVGLHEIPIRHGLTIGELALMMRAEKKIDVDLKVKKLSGWKRRSYFEETGLPWVLPSPNLPTPTSTLVYPGMELLEGTNLSEGRGTTHPFEFFGAPFIDAEKLALQLNDCKLPGVHFRPAAFQPTFDKYKGELCFGAQIHLLQPKKIRSVEMVVAILQMVLQHYPNDFKFLNPPYEYEDKLMPFDILAGTDSLRRKLLAGENYRKIVSGWQSDLKAFQKRRRPYLLY